MSRHNRQNKQLILSESDAGKLKALVETAKRYLSDREYIEQLDEKLEDAKVVDPEDVPADLVEVDKSVRVTDLDRSEEKVYRVVFPREANYEGRISVIAPLGSALLGSRVGDVVEVHAPGRTRRVRVDEIVGDGGSVAA